LYCFWNKKEKDLSIKN